MRWWLILGLVATGCEGAPCVTGDPETCEMPPVCDALSFDGGGEVAAYTIEPGGVPTQGIGALAAVGDFVLSNDRVIAVIDALDHPHNIAAGGGSLIDLQPVGGYDVLRTMHQVTGLLPTEAALFDRVRILTEGANRAVQFTGTLDGRPNVRIATKYELRPGDPGVRIRTEVRNLEPDAGAFYLGEIWFWGERDGLPFSPGAGFIHPSYSLSTVPSAMRDNDFLVFGAMDPPGSAIAVVGCNVDQVVGVHHPYVSGLGRDRQILQRRDYTVFEQFVAVADGVSPSGAVELAMDVRRQLFDEPVGRLTGRLVPDGGGGEIGTQLRASILVSEGTPNTPDDERVARTHVIPGPDGTFDVAVPPDRDYVLSVEAFGQRVADVAAHVGPNAGDAGDITIPAVGELTIAVDVVDRRGLLPEPYPTQDVLVFVYPADDATDAAVRGKMLGNMVECAPLLGHPHGGSPACNRVLVNGTATVTIPPGTYDLVATVGAYSTASVVRDLVIEALTGQSVELPDVEILPIAPDGALSGDFHVHGSSSFDSNIPETDRVRAFLAADIDVIVATEHSTAADYATAMEALGAGDRLELIVGTESTGLTWFEISDDYAFAVAGHWNAWPIVYDPEGAWRGAPWDQKAEPGTLMTRLRDDAGWDPDAGVVQLNHPLSGIILGRAFGWADSLALDGNLPLKTTYDGTGQSVFLRTPPGAAFSNDAYHSQEVMNGTTNGDYLKYREFWFYLLNQGILRTGTGCSDSHSLTENVLGTPRSLVWSDTSLDDFDVAVFDAAIRAGHVLSTNGPVVLATMEDASGDRLPGVEPFAPASTMLSLEVRAAPWIPVDEIRIFVNGEVAQTITELSDPADPLATADDVTEGDIVRFSDTIDLAGLLPASGDAYVVIEVGTPHAPAGDLNCDAFPDTADNNGDGTIDWRDVDALTEDPEVDCFDNVGPMDPLLPEEDLDTPLGIFSAAVPQGYPLAVTNPFVLDLDGGGYTGSLQ